MLFNTETPKHTEVNPIRRSTVLLICSGPVFDMGLGTPMFRSQLMLEDARAK
jgi:hypothetical protein